MSPFMYKCVSSYLSGLLIIVIGHELRYCYHIITIVYNIAVVHYWQSTFCELEQIYSGIFPQLLNPEHQTYCLSSVLCPIFFKSLPIITHAFTFSILLPNPY